MKASGRFETIVFLELLSFVLPSGNFHGAQPMAKHRGW
jgi:hypothetical protein